MSVNLYAQDTKDAVFFGTIKNFKNSKIYLSFRNNPIDTIDTRIEIKLNDKNQFYESYQLSKAIDAKLILDKDTLGLYMSPSESIELQYDYKKKNANYISKYNNNKFLFEFNYFYNDIEKLKSKSNLDFIEFSAELEKLKTKHLEQLNQFNSKFILAGDFIKLQKLKYIYQIANEKYEFLKHKNLLELKYSNSKEFEPYLFYESLSSNQPEYLLIKEYRTYLINNIYYKFYQSDLKNLTEQEQMRLKFDLAMNTYEGREQHYVLTYILGDLLDQYTYLYVKTLISEYMSTIRNQEYRSYIDIKIQKAIRRLE